MDQTIEYVYKPKAGVMLLGILFCSACAWWLGSEAKSNTQSLIIDGLIRLDPHNTMIFNWVLSAISVIFAIFGVFGLAVSFQNDRRLYLSGDTITISKMGFSKSVYTLRIVDITQLGIQTVKRQRFLVLVCGDKKRHINASCLPSDAAFDELHQAIIQKIRENQRRAA